MKLRNILIENFRQIDRWSHDFTDSLGRVRDLTVLMGPNASGKTSILDAIAAALNPLTHLNAIRPGLDLSPRRVVRHRALYAHVQAEVEFSQMEIETALSVYDLLDDHKEFERSGIRNSGRVTFAWTFPDPQGKLDSGRTACQPGAGWSIFATRARISRMLGTQRLTDFSLFGTAGAVYTFDQERSLIGRAIPRAVWEVLANTGSLPLPPAETPEKETDRRTTDARLLLLSMAIQAMLPPQNGSALAKSDFDRVKEEYARVCSPYSIRGAVRDDLDRFDVEFFNGANPYWYSDLSSGEQMVLLLLIRFVTERIHRSIVLIDEVELHQHPIWQRRLLHSLPKMGLDNQIIATTHSDYLRDVLPSDQICTLGDVREPVTAKV